jgi:hypothetical protein
MGFHMPKFFLQGGRPEVLYLAISDIVKMHRTVEMV